MSTPLLEEMARRLQASPEEARQALHALRRELLAEAREAGQAEVPGLGVFHLRNGTLRFEPSEPFARAVNHRFAGLEPISVEAPATAAPSRTSAPQDERPHEEADPAAAVPNDPAAPSASESALTSSQATSEVSFTERLAAFSRAGYAVVPTGLFANRQLVESDFVGAKLLPAGASAADSPPGEEAAPEPTTVHERSPAASAAAERRRPAVLPWAAALLALLLVGTGLWYVLGRQDSVRGPFEDSAAATADNAPATAEQPAAPEETSGDADAEEASAAASPEALAPAGIERTPGTWTIILSSETERDTAEAVQQDFRRRLSDLSYPVGILEGTTDGVTRYRVAVGQFASLEEAQEALRRTAERLPEGAWLLEIESDL